MVQLSTDGEEASDRDEPNYNAVEVPTDVPPSELHYTQRRAEILEIVMAAGHPSAISQAQLAERFEVSQSTISRDLDRIDEYFRQNTGRRRDLESHAVYRRVIRELINEEEYVKAARVQKWYDEYRDERINSLEFRQRLDRLEDVADRQGSQR